MNINRSVSYKFIIFLSLILSTLFYSKTVLANDVTDQLLKLLTEAKSEIEKGSNSNTTTPLNTNLDTTNEEFQTQEELNLFIDEYLKESVYKDTFYTDSESIGDVKILIKNKYLFLNEPIDISIFKISLDPTLDFDKAKYTFSITQGDKILETKENLDTPEFQYTFRELGKYQIRVKVTFPNGQIREGFIPIEMIDEISLDYTPLSPAAGDKIEVTVPYIDKKDDIIDWTVNGEPVDIIGNKLEFLENKGVGSEYIIQAIVKDSITGISKYYGKSTISIKSPVLRVDVNNLSDINLPLDINNLSLNNETELEFISNISNINSNTKLNYVYRVNEETITGQNEKFKLKVDPNKFYRVYITVTDSNRTLFLDKTILINKNLEALDTEENSELENKNPFLDRYLGLVVLGFVGIGGFYMSKYAIIKG